MQIIDSPAKADWTSLTKRPAIQQQELAQLVNQVFDDIQKDGDEAVKKYRALFDKVSNTEMAIDAAMMKQAADLVPAALKDAIQLAAGNIEKFHTAQKETPQIITTAKGVNCWRESRPIETIGLYIPGGSAPLFSTVLMLAIPAKIAGCKEIILCTPPAQDGTIHPAILYAASCTGVTRVFGVGGIQAIGAMALGTTSIPKVDKIFGPGNQYVTAAKQAAQLMGVAIDMPAGPSEVLIIADTTCVPSFVAADLLSQAEHGADSQVMLLSDNAQMIKDVLAALQEQVESLPRKEIALQALQHSKAIRLNSVADCVDFSNLYAPEHLILAMNDAGQYVARICNAGSVFIGNYSCESAGDYASGTNHTLPTNGYARSYSGVSLDSFVKKITFQELTSEGIRNIGPAIETMAIAEQLYAHKNAVTLRLKNL